MTTLAIAMMIGTVALGLVFLAVGDDLSRTEITLRALIAIIFMAAIVMLSEPLKNFLQERADRSFTGQDTTFAKAYSILAARCRPQRR
jgi:hypothetical protein